MSTASWTIVVMISAAVILIVWDVYVAFFNKISNRKDTISGILLNASRGKGVWGLPFAFGVLGGHLFLPGVSPLVGYPEGPIILVNLVAIFTVCGMVYRRFWEYSPDWPYIMFIMLGLGIMSGHLFWPQGM